MNPLSRPCVLDLATILRSIDLVIQSFTKWTKSWFKPSKTIFLGLGYPSRNFQCRCSILNRINYILTPAIQDDIPWNWQCLQKLQMSLSVIYFLIELTTSWPGASRNIFVGIGILPETLHLANLFFMRLPISWSLFNLLSNWFCPKQNISKQWFLDLAIV